MLINHYSAAFSSSSSSSDEALSQSLSSEFYAFSFLRSLADSLAFFLS